MGEPQHHGGAGDERHGRVPSPQLARPIRPDDHSSDRALDGLRVEGDREPMNAAGPSAREGGSPHAPPAEFADAPENQRPPIGPLDPGSMHRRENDGEAFARSSDFHDVSDPGSHQR